METVHRLPEWLKETAREHWLPVLLVFLSVNIAAWSLESLWPLIVPATALAVGLLLRPRHLWVVWIASVVSLWIAVGVWEIFNDPSEPVDPENQETIVSVFFESFIFMAVGVLLPLWIGRLGRAEIDDWREERREHRHGMTP